MLPTLILLSGHTFRSARFSFLNGQRISWTVPAETRVEFGVAKGKTLPYTLVNVKLADGRRENLAGLFAVMRGAPDDLEGNIFPLGQHRFLMVSGGHNTRTELAALHDLFRGIHITK